jgi:hypothetical protein
VGAWGGGVHRGDGICALVVGDPLMAPQMAWGGGWGGGIRRGAGISRRRGGTWADSCTEAERGAGVDAYNKAL